MLSPTFPTSTLQIMAKLGLSENDVLDVYYKGEESKTETGTTRIVKKYQSYGYEIGLFYATNQYTGQPIITYVWKRSRR